MSEAQKGCEIKLQLTKSEGEEKDTILAFNNIVKKFTPETGSHLTLEVDVTLVAPKQECPSTNSSREKDFSLLIKIRPTGYHALMQKCTQFAHELVHSLCWLSGTKIEETRKHRHHWFEEVCCNIASIHIMNPVAMGWRELKLKSTIFKVPRKWSEYSIQWLTEAKKGFAMTGSPRVCYEGLTRTGTQKCNILEEFEKVNNHTAETDGPIVCMAEWFYTYFQTGIKPFDWKDFVTALRSLNDASNDTDGFQAFLQRWVDHCSGNAAKVAQRFYDEFFPGTASTTSDTPTTTSDSTTTTEKKKKKKRKTKKRITRKDNNPGKPQEHATKENTDV